MKRGVPYILSLVAALVAVVSCSTNGCLENQSAVPRCGFYSMGSKSAVSIDSISVYAVGVPGDSMLVRCGKGVTSLYMPLDMSADVTHYVLHYDAEMLRDERLNDTLTIHYDRVPYFVSSECGAMFFFDVTGYEYTRHLVDSVAVTTTRFTNVDTETIKFYMRTGD